MASSKQEREAREARDRLKRYTARQQVHQRSSKRRMRDNIVAVVGVLVVAALAAATQIFFFTAGPGAPTPEPSASASASAAAGENVGAPDASLSESRVWTGTMTLNTDIELGIELDGTTAPQAVAGFVQDSESGYYIDKTCHRLATQPTFQLLQCGSLDGTGASDPSFSYGPIENAPADDVYPAGTIAMARAGGDAYSNGHQFFLVTADTTIPSDAAGGYTVVGRITSGLDALVAGVITPGIDPAAVGQDGTGAPLVPTTITALTLQ